MKRTIIKTILAISTTGLAFGQPAEAPPKFEAADIHSSAKAQNPFVRSATAHGRYEIKFATMVDLIHLAYGFDNDKILGGPSWLEMDRYDVTGKVPPDSNPDSLKLMLQALLADRFKLEVHPDTKPLPTYALVAGKKPQMKEAEGTEDSGCKPLPQSGGGPDGGGMRFMVSTAGPGGGGGAPQTFSLGPGGLIAYACRNMTMAAFASGLRSMFGTSLGNNPIVDDTGLKGAWNFEVRWTMGLFPVGGAANQGDKITVFEALEKQLGLKLEERQVPTPVMMVAKVNEKPTENPPGTADVLPVIPAPTEFEVASIKPAEPSARGGLIGFRPQTGGRFTANGLPMRILLSQAFLTSSPDQIAGLPSWVDSETFDINAKTATDGGAAPTLDREAMAPMLRALLKDRFKMTYHTEDRQVSAYTLMAGKPKMKKADPTSRTFCKNAPPPPGAAPGTRVITCQNATMAQFAERLQNATPELNLPVADATGIEGGWDFTLTFSFNFAFNFGGPRGGDGGAGGPAAPADPSGGLTVFEAIEKELGLKLEKQKRTVPTVVIDHLEQKPTEN